MTRCLADAGQGHQGRERRRRPHVRSGNHRSINAIFSLKSYLPFDVLPEWQAVRSRPLEEQWRALRDPERRQLVAAESRMKPKDNKLQGGGAATTDPRKPDYGKLFALKGVDWDDPTVEEIAARGAHIRSKL